MDLRNWRNWCNRGGNTKVSSFPKITVSLLRAVSANMSSLAALVACLPSGVERATVWSSAITRNVSEFSASITFLGLCLAISSKVVWTAALITCSRARSTSKSASRSKSTTEPTSRSTKTASSTWDRAWTSWAWARTSQMPWLSARITSRASARESQSRAVGLNMSHSRARIALLRFTRTWQGAAVRLMSGLFAVIA